MKTMKIREALKKILVSPNGCSREPIFETYDKNVQGNTVWERGKVAASVITPFRDFPELSDKSSKTGVAIANGGNPNLAKVSARIAAENAVVEAVVKVSCVGGVPLALTDCLNFGNPEKKEQMGEFVAGVEGVKLACEALEIPVVSGNVSFYNESSGTSIPPSALVSVFARVDDPTKVPELDFKKEGETVFLVGARSEHLGGSALMEIANKKDTRIPEVDFKSTKKWLGRLQQVASLNLISSAYPIGLGGVLVALAKSSFENEIGVDIRMENDPFDKLRAGEWRMTRSTSSGQANRKGENMVSFLFSEDAGVIISTSFPEKVQEIFGGDALEIGKTTKEFNLKIEHKTESVLNQELGALKELYQQGLREVF